MTPPTQSDLGIKQTNPEETMVSAVIYRVWWFDVLWSIAGEKRKQMCCYVGTCGWLTTDVWLFWSVSGWSDSGRRHNDGTAPGLSRTVPPGVSFSKQSSLKCSLQMVISVQDDSLKRCLLTVARNWTHSSLCSGSSGNLNRWLVLLNETHPTTEHIADLKCVPPAVKATRQSITCS